MKNKIKSTMIDYKTGYDLLIISVIHFRAQHNRTPAFVTMNPEFYARMVNDLRPGESFEPMSNTVAGIPIKMDAKRLSFLLEGGEA